MKKRLLLSCLGLTLGLSSPSVLAQNAPKRSAQFGRPIAIQDAPAPSEPQPVGTGAVEGYDPNDPGVTPAGLFSRPRGGVSTSQQLPLTPSFVPSVRPQGAAPVGTGAVGSPWPAGAVPGYPVGTTQTFPVGTVPGYPAGTVQGYPAAPSPGGIVTYPVSPSPAGIPGFGTVINSMPMGTPGFPTQATPMQMPIGKGPEVGPSVTEVRDGSSRPKTSPMASGAAIVGTPMAMMSEGAVPSMEDPFFSGGGAGCANGHCMVDRLNRLFGGGIFEPRTGAARYWMSAEYLSWWVRNTTTPILATSTVTPGSDAFIGQAGTIPVLGGSTLGENPLNGFRLGLGWWFSDCQTHGLDARIFVLGQGSANQAVNSETFPLLTRPFFNLNQAIPFGETVAFPGFAVGAVGVNLQTSIWGAEANYRRRLDCGQFPCARLDGLVGFRYFNLKDQLNIDESFIRSGTAVPSVGIPNVVAGLVQDQFRTENNFYGGQFGVTGEVRRGRFYVDGRATVALGSTFQSAEIYGAQNLVLANGSLIQSQGGLLTATGANIGKFTQSKFAVMPEVGVNFGYHITPHLRAFVGYNFLYLSSVLRAGDTIDTNLDVTRIPNFPLNTPLAPLPGTPRPMPILKTTDFVAQGINFGMAYTW